MASGRPRRAGTIGLADNSTTDRETSKGFFYDTGERYLSVPDMFPADNIETDSPAASGPA